MYAEFAAATTILRERNMSALVHQMVREKIAEAKASVSDEEFRRVVESHKEDIVRRSDKKQAERNRPL
jgi:Na+-translocating ferredoxin:NAD+ oxidoreductase RnfG subunit